MGEPRLKGRIAVVTGGGRGLGRAIVRALAREGADVAFSYRESRRGALEEAEAVRRLGRRSFTGPADARVPGEVAAFVEEAAEVLGGPDLLVNNVGVFRRVPLDEMSEEVLDEAFDVNVKAAVMATQAAAPHMRRRGGGAIVNVASLGGLRPWPSHLAYCASKAALVMATRCLAVALAPQIRVNAVAPGVLDPPGAEDAVRRRIPAGRFGTLAEAVEAILFLLAEGGHTTGQVLSVDGGRGLV
ncbi:MAG: SDR family oxidoreductase [Acidobacteria bacterium]|jgi:3-oxoacyl-[acyl-carrier protein] reductase/pteridine reductase|nr:SDR family oxidoreductase [Acidobacteriota bacterium]